MNIDEEAVLLETPDDVSVIVPKQKRKSKGPRKTPKMTKPAKRKAGSKRGPKGWAPEDRMRNGSKKFGLALRKKRLELGWTQAQMGMELGIKQPHMCNLEKGTFAPGPKLLALIEKKYLKHTVKSRSKRTPRKEA